MKILYPNIMSTRFQFLINLSTGVFGNTFVFCFRSVLKYLTCLLLYFQQKIERGLYEKQSKIWDQMDLSQSNRQASKHLWWIISETKLQLFLSFCFFFILFNTIYFSISSKFRLCCISICFCQSQLILSFSQIVL
jgi:hypothetical protein